jgi:hypothetical protein
LTPLLPEADDPREETTMKTTTEMAREEMAPARRPEEDVLSGVLGRLEREGRWVDVLDLPFPTTFGRDARRALLRAFALEGTLELARHPVYPSLLKARITDMGRRRLGPTGNR